MRWKGTATEKLDVGYRAFEVRGLMILHGNPMPDPGTSPLAFEPKSKFQLRIRDTENCTVPPVGIFYQFRNR